MVIIFLGSKSDIKTANEIEKHLIYFAVKAKAHIASAHKTPEYLLELVSKYERLREKKVYICVAGKSNALGGFVDAQVSCPVINCPPYSDSYGGLDILSSLRMPSGVCPMTVLEPEQAALSAVKILSLTDDKLSEKVKQYQNKLKNKIISGNKEISESNII